MLPKAQIHEMLMQAFPDAIVELVDLTGTQDHYDAKIASSAFEGKTLVEQHKLVYAALGEAMHGPIHALALKTYTPQAWAQQTTFKNTHSS